MSCKALSCCPPDDFAYTAQGGINSPIQGFDPILKAPYPSKNYGLTIHSPGQPRGTFTQPDVLAIAEITIDTVGGGTQPGMAAISVLNYDGGDTTAAQLGNVLTLAGGAFTFIDTASNAGQKIYWAGADGIAALSATILTVTDSTHAVVTDSKTVAAGQFTIIPPGTTIYLWVRDDVQSPSFERWPIGVNLLTYACWVDATNFPSPGPSYPLRIAAHVDDLYPAYNTNYTFYLEFVAGSSSVLSNLLPIYVPIPV